MCTPLPGFFPASVGSDPKTLSLQSTSPAQEQLFTSEIYYEFLDLVLLTQILGN